MTEFQPPCHPAAADDYTKWLHEVNGTDHKAALIDYAENPNQETFFRLIGVLEVMSRRHLPPHEQAKMDEL